MGLFYKLIVGAVLGGYALTGLMGWDFSSAQKRPMPPNASVRSSPGGHRSFHFWHTGFHGGK